MSTQSQPAGQAFAFISYGVRYACPFRWYNMESVRVSPYRIVFLIVIYSVD
jgi:hypothetical protein